jgi:glycosyltransferase involved in cell wall biosynthesis
LLTERTLYDMSKQDLISIIVPCYNLEPYINECLQSIYNQTYPFWECIIIDDGSTDNSKDIIRKWTSTDNRFTYIQQHKNGVSSARNQGLRIAKGEYIQFLDGDDTINKNKFENQIKLFNDNIEIVICDYFPYDEETEAFRRDRYLTPFPNTSNHKKEIILHWENKLSIPIHSILFKQSLLSGLTTLLFDESLPNHNDWHFWVRVFYKSNQIHFSKEAFANYRIRKQSICSDFSAMNQGFVIAAEKVLDFFIAENDKEFMNYAHQKLKEVKNKHDRYTSNPEQILNTESHNPLSWRSPSFFSSARKMISLITPPIFWHLWQRLKNMRNNSSHK